MTSGDGRTTGEMRDRLRESVIITAIVAAFAATAGAVFWIQAAPDRATAGPGPSMAKPVTGAAPRASAPEPGGPDVAHSDVYFDFKSTRLRADAASVLQEQAVLLKKGGVWVVLVQGYADQQGPAAYNRTLAQQRAETVRQFLAELGVPDTSMKVVVIGQGGALCDDPDRACQQLNRRVHLEARRLPRAVAEAGAVRAHLGEGDQLGLDDPDGR
jgi:outer membrane protein OmpA-like peptidoglycan-associated protein